MTMPDHPLDWRWCATCGSWDSLPSAPPCLGCGGLPWARSGWAPKTRAHHPPGELPPEVLVDALQDRIHPTSGRLLAAKPIATTVPRCLRRDR